jgi:hypothetical protein
MWRRKEVGWQLLMRRCDCGLLAAGCWLLAAGCWLLAAGCWLLAAGCWLLAAGCWGYGHTGGLLVLVVPCSYSMGGISACAGCRSSRRWAILQC